MLVCTLHRPCTTSSRPPSSTHLFSPDHQGQPLNCPQPKKGITRRRWCFQLPRNCHTEFCAWLSQLRLWVVKEEESTAVNSSRCLVACSVGVAYEVPFSCNRIYMGQTGRCLNGLLREHPTSLRAPPSGRLTIHAKDRRCVPFFDKTVVTYKISERVSFEKEEATAPKKRRKSQRPRPVRRHVLGSHDALYNECTKTPTRTLR